LRLCNLLLVTTLGVLVKRLIHKKGYIFPILLTLVCATPSFSQSLYERDRQEARRAYARQLREGWQSRQAEENHDNVTIIAFGMHNEFLVFMANADWSVRSVQGWLQDRNEYAEKGFKSAIFLRPRRKGDPANSKFTLRFIKSSENPAKVFIYTKYAEEIF